MKLLTLTKNPQLPSYASNAVSVTIILNSGKLSIKVRQAVSGSIDELSDQSNTRKCNLTTIFKLVEGLICSLNPGKFISVNENVKLA